MNKQIDETAKHLINRAVKEFGPMRSEWSYCGIEINDGYPHLIYNPLLGQIKISLTSKVKEDYNQLLYQLAHEVCHLLYPTIDINTGIQEPTTVLNEGISTYFATCVTGEILGLEYLKELIELNSQNSPNYSLAMALVTELLSIDENAIIKLRKIKPKLNDIKTQHFEEAGINIESELKENLLKIFI